MARLSCNCAGNKELNGRKTNKTKQSKPVFPSPRIEGQCQKLFSASSVHTMVQISENLDLFCFFNCSTDLKVGVIAPQTSFFSSCTWCPTKETQNVYNGGHGLVLRLFKCRASFDRNCRKFRNWYPVRHRLECANNSMSISLRSGCRPQTLRNQRK